MVAVIRKQRTRERAEIPTLKAQHVLDVDSGVRREDRADRMRSGLNRECRRAAAIAHRT